MRLMLITVAIVFCFQINTELKAQNRQRYEAQRRKEKEEAQQRQPTSVIDIPKITLLMPGFSYEKALGKFQTLQAYALYNVYSYSKNSSGNVQTNYYFDPTIMLSYRYYCNHDRRQDLGKVTERNTMNYIGPFAQVYFSKMPVGSRAFENATRRPVYMFGALYGLQRNYKSHFSLDINFGLGVISGNTRYSDLSSGIIREGNQTQVTVPGQITLGFWLGGK